MKSGGGNPMGGVRWGDPMGESQHGGNPMGGVTCGESHGGESGVWADKYFLKFFEQHFPKIFWKNIF